MKKSIRNGCMLLLFGLGLIVHGRAQDGWKFQGDLFSFGGYEWNVFHSPESYFDNTGVPWLRDSLIQSGLLLEPGVDLVATRTGERGRWRSALSADSRQYRTLSEANRREVQWRFERRQILGKGLTGLMAGRLRDSKRIALNILGDELLTSFSFFQAQVDVALSWKPSESFELTLGGEGFSKRFDARTTGQSLDQNELSLESGFAWRPNRAQGQSKLDLVGRKRRFSGVLWTGGFELRDKQYLNWVNGDLLAPVVDSLATTPFLPFDSTVTYPLRHWRYATFRLRCDVPVGAGWRARLDARKQAREDRSLGDFGYKDFKMTARLGWVHPEGLWEWSLSASRTWRDYTDRLAEQVAGVPYPNLLYRFSRLDAQASRRLGKRSAIELRCDLDYRGSNTTAEDRRTRRGYRTGSLLLGYRLQFTN